jgi:NAD(P)H-hydrate epimerase
MFKYKPTVYLPKPGNKDIYQRLLKQVENLNIPVLHDVEEFDKALRQTDVILDAIFGKDLSAVELVEDVYLADNEA